MINSSISECDYKCETGNAEPEIGSDKSSQTRRDQHVVGYGAGFETLRASRLRFWNGFELNRPILADQKPDS